MKEKKEYHTGERIIIDSDIFIIGRVSLKSAILIDIKDGNRWEDKKMKLKSINNCAYVTKKILEKHIGKDYYQAGEKIWRRK